MMTESSEPKGTVAIIGSGPAGLFATHALSKKGYLVTIFEKVRIIFPAKYYGCERK